MQRTLIFRAFWGDEMCSYSYNILVIARNKCKVDVQKQETVPVVLTCLKTIVLTCHQVFFFSRQEGLIAGYFGAYKSRHGGPICSYNQMEKERDHC